MLRPGDPPTGEARRADRPPAEAKPSEIPPPTGRDDAAAWQRFVECWQDRFYSLARRMLRCDDRARDATQEIFLAIWRARDRRDPERPLRGWLYRLAMNTLLAEMRRDRRRRRREREAAVPDRTAPSDDPVEIEERERIIGGHLEALPPRSRALLLLHYQHGLSQREIARTLGTSRTTVQDRLGKALDHLRRSLRKGGHLALIPLVEATLGSTRLDAAPPLLTQSLLAVPQTAAVGGVTGGTLATLTWGGLTMSKLTTVIVAVAAISLTIGLGAGGAFGPGEKSPTNIDDPALTDLEARLDEQAERLAALRAENADLAEQLAAATEAREGTEAELAAAREALANAQAAIDDVDPIAAAVSGETIDWAAFETAVRENSDLILRVGEAFATGAEPGDILTREELARFMALRRMWDDAASIALRDSIHPFLESEVLPPLVGALFTGPLDLDPRQRGDLLHAAEQLLAAWPGASDGTPLEAWQARRAIHDGLNERIGDLLGPDQAARWENLRPLTDQLLEGSQRHSALGLNGTEGVPDRVRDDWLGHYGIRDEQRAAFDRVLADYDRAVRAEMGRALPEGTSLRDLSDEEAAALRARYLDEQLRAEAAILDLLDEAQRAELRERRPAIYTFEPTGSTSISISENGGF